MKWLIAVAAVLFLPAGCSGGGGSTAAQMGSITELQPTMKKAGVACAGTLVPPEKSEVGHVLTFGVIPAGAGNEPGLGALPAEQLKCVIGGVDVTVFRYRTQPERVEAMGMAEKFACDVDIKDAYWVGAGPFVLGAFDTTAKGNAVTKKIGKALGAEVSRFSCGFG